VKSIGSRLRVIQVVLRLGRFSRDLVMYDPLHYLWTEPLARGTASSYSFSTIFNQIHGHGRQDMTIQISAWTG
jgi:hypothetical protein